MLSFAGASCHLLQRVRGGEAALHAHAPRPAPGHQNRRAVHHQSQVGRWLRPAGEGETGAVQGGIWGLSFRGCCCRRSPGREGLPTGWSCWSWSTAWLILGRERGCWPGLCRVPGGRQGSGKSRRGGGRWEVSAHCPWPHASRLACVPLQGAPGASSPPLCAPFWHEAATQQHRWGLLGATSACSGQPAARTTPPWGGLGEQQPLLGTGVGVTCHSPVCRGVWGAGGAGAVPGSGCCCSHPARSAGCW